MFVGICQASADDQPSAVGRQLRAEHLRSTWKGSVLKPDLTPDA
jgi:hypothetical protein